MRIAKCSVFVFTLLCFFLLPICTTGRLCCDPQCRSECVSVYGCVCIYVYVCACVCGLCKNSPSVLKRAHQEGGAEGRGVVRTIVGL